MGIVLSKESKARISELYRKKQTEFFYKNMIKGNQINLLYLKDEIASDSYASLYSAPELTDEERAWLLQERVVSKGYTDGLYKKIAQQVQDTLKNFEITNPDLIVEGQDVKIGNKYYRYPIVDKLRGLFAESAKGLTAKVISEDSDTARLQGVYRRIYKEANSSQIEFESEEDFTDHIALQVLSDATGEITQARVLGEDISQNYATPKNKVDKLVDYTDEEYEEFTKNIESARGSLYTKLNNEYRRILAEDKKLHRKPASYYFSSAVRKDYKHSVRVSARTNIFKTATPAERAIMLEDLLGYNDAECIDFLDFSTNRNLRKGPNVLPYGIKLANDSFTIGKKEYPLEVFYNTVSSTKGVFTIPARNLTPLLTDEEMAELTKTLTMHARSLTKKNYADKEEYKETIMVLSTAAALSDLTRERYRYNEWVNKVSGTTEKSSKPASAMGEDE